ncbi:ABC transporter ATP-binding protein [Mycoplasmopsis lipofaciens]|uniref:ABC transporter ATP-binding protein n=1 Tax=Mycoplasmopsis lipofaciens TaxID=114884 RepID=UPI000489BB84|nr:ABC transporter ATP-binding protein [Mycoplasmopsis lipofaciens]
MENNFAIEVKNVNKYFKDKKRSTKHALKNVSFTVKKGSFHGFIGANGAGKTTLFRSLLGFYPDVEGEILINNISFKNIEFKRFIGYVPEIATFPKNFSVLQYLLFMAECSGLSKYEAKNRVMTWLKSFNIPKEIFMKKGNYLSSGQKKKILLIQALIHNPQILILDEPAANLDPKVRVELYENLKEINKKGITIFISSHILTELAQYIDSFTVLELGEVKENKSIKEIEQNQEFNYRIESEDIDKIELLVKNLQSNENSKIKYLVSDFNILIKCNDKEFDNIVSSVLQNNLSYKSIGVYKMSLNDIYFNVTQGE